MLGGLRGPCHKAAAAHEILRGPEVCHALGWNPQYDNLAKVADVDVIANAV